MGNACTKFSLVFPTWPWLPWLIAIIGVAITVFLIKRGTPEGVEISIKEGTLKFGGFTIGIFFIVVGIAIAATDYHPPFARWIGEKFPSFVSDADVEIKGQFHDLPLKNIVSTANTGGRFSTRLAPKAGDIPITGEYEAQCGADLIYKICQKEGQRLFCDVDADDRIIRICSKSDVTPCKDRIL